MASGAPEHSMWQHIREIVVETELQLVAGLSARGTASIPEEGPRTPQAPGGKGGNLSHGGQDRTCRG